MIYLIGDLLFGGTETITNTLTWSIIYLLHYPDVMRKVQEEIDKVLGRNGIPSMMDKQKMPYVEATVMEIQRMADVAPLAVPHSGLEDVELRGYTIPKGTTVMSNLYAVHRDDRIWEDPYQFKPSRFLDKNGEIVRRNELIPFSVGKLICIERVHIRDLYFNGRIKNEVTYQVKHCKGHKQFLADIISGKRSCVGEALARMELFLFFTTMCQHFTFKLPPGEKLPSLVGRLGLSHVPPPFKVLAIQRG